MALSKMTLRPRRTRVDTADLTALLDRAMKNVVKLTRARNKAAKKLERARQRVTVIKQLMNGVLAPRRKHTRLDGTDKFEF